MKIFTLFLALFCLAFAARAQEINSTPTPTPVENSAPTIGTLVSAGIPLSMTIGDLNASWRRISVGESSTRIDAARDQINRKLPIVNLMQSVVGAQDSVFWTQWQTATAGAHAFLVAYRVRDFDEESLEKLFPLNLKTPPSASQFTATIPSWMRARPLDLVLLNLKTVKIIDGAQRFDFNAQVARVRSWANQNLPVAAPRVSSRTRIDELREMALLIALYAQRNDGTIPPMSNFVAFKNAVAPYVKSAVSLRNDKPFYSLNAVLSGKKMAHISAPRDMIALYETEGDANGARLVAFLDGSVRKLDAKEWLKYKRGSKIK